MLLYASLLRFSFSSFTAFFSIFLSNLFPIAPNNLKGAETIVPNILPARLNPLVKNFFNGLTIYFSNDSPNGFITLSLKTPTTFSFILSHPALNISLTFSAASCIALVTGPAAFKNGSAIESYKKSETFMFHSFIVIFNESTTCMSNHVENLVINPP